MPKHQNNDEYTEYDVYELWWKFLKLSDSYREFCEIMRYVTDTESEVFYRQFDEGYKKIHPESKEIIDYDHFDQKYYSNHLLNWEFMGDVHVNGFDRWWENWELPKNKSYSILDLRDPDIRKKLPIYQFALHMNKKKKRKPLTPEEVINYFTIQPEYIFVAIPIGHEMKTTEIREMITAMRKAARKEHYDELKINECRFRKPYGSKRYSEIEKYHDIYHCVHVERMSLNKAKERTGVLDSSVFSKYRNNAIEIIKNVEEGIFPGKEYWGKSS